MNKKIIIIFSLIAFIFTSCEKQLIGTDEINSPENNFEIFWKHLDQHYGIFHVRNLNWDSIYTEYKPQVKPTTTNTELWRIFSEMIDHLDDSHTLIYDNIKDTTHRSSYVLNKKARDIMSQQLVEDHYLESVKYIDAKKRFSYGKLKNKDIGYIYLERFIDFDYDAIDIAINNIENNKALIFDLRSNRGGEGDMAERYASAFADGTHYVYSSQDKIGPAHDAFGPKKEHYTSVSKSKVFRKPIIVLTDRATISAAEEFLLHIKAFADVIQIGDTTAGDFSDVSPMQYLPNGWIYRYSHQMYLLPNGTSLDGIGHIPDIIIKNTQANIANNEDKVLEKAIDFLFNQYGIQ